MFLIRAPNSPVLRNASGINGYSRPITRTERSQGVHKDLVGGKWDELGALQFEFMRQQGLLPHHDFLDVGCGTLRGGVHFIRYLKPNRYYGVDINLDLLEAGVDEVNDAGLASKAPTLLETDSFEVQRLAQTFDFALAQSLFTHLLLNQIGRCLRAVAAALRPGGKFFATFYRAPHACYTETIEHGISDFYVASTWDKVPFYHQSIEELSFFAREVGLTPAFLGEWGHPRFQRMMLFEKKR